MDAVAVIDFETTGLSPAQGDRATEIAAVNLPHGESFHDGYLLNRRNDIANLGAEILRTNVESKIALVSSATPSNVVKR